ncbi:MAG TPA: mannose-1-phosphate guanylyltransferase [Bacteroidales bacterium]|jgi:mannose-1-phosphate guanylyltransferase|nr:mannose-1-phosphate guanylyltransferase [Bacteroidales bacterium]
MSTQNYCVIMAGGVGSRFWPFSRSQKPKQFLDILGTGQSLLQSTFERFNKIIPKENILIVSNADYADIILEQLPEITKDQVLLEPMRRNTAPCIAFANYKIKSKDPEANIVVTPADHIILKEMQFLSVVENGLKFVDENDALLTLGIQPSRPETGYGYIQISGEKDNIELNKSFRKVKTFTEKPNHELAQKFLESGDFFWNSGMFFWSLNAINKSFEQHLPDVDNLFKDGLGKYNTEEEQTFIDSAYSKCKNISIDYGIMEKASNVHVLCADIGWSDLGTWGSLYDISDKDANKNFVNGGHSFLYDTKNCMVSLSENKIAVIQGLEDSIVVDADDILLICKKKEEQRIKQFVNDVKLEKGEEYI